MGRRAPRDPTRFEILAIGPFGGVDPTTPPISLAQTNFVSASNVVPNVAYGGYVTMPGRVAMGTLPGTITGIGVMHRPNQPDTYLLAVTTAGVGHIYAGPYGGPFVGLTLPAPLDPNLTTQFVECGSWVFVNNGVDPPLKINTNLTVTLWGIVAPNAAPTQANSGAGNLTGTYTYCETFSNAVQESSQGVISASNTVTNKQITVTPHATTTDTQVTTRNLYRIGGASGTWTLVRSQGVNDLTPFVDNIADAALTGQGLIVFRDAPPAFNAIAVYQDRMLGFGTASDPSQIAWSNYGEPYGFNFNINTIDAGYNALGDVAVACGAPNAEMCLLLKTRSYFLFVGNSDDTFSVIPGENVGCASQQSFAVGDGKAMWAARSGLQLFTPSGRQNVSDTGYQQSNVKTIYSAFDGADLAQCAAGYWDKTFIFSFPTRQESLLIDTRSGQWFPLSIAFSHAFGDSESDVPLVADNLNAVGQLVQWFASTTNGDLGAEIYASILSRISDAAMLEADKQAEFAYVEAPDQAAFVAVTLYCNPGSQQVAVTQIINLDTPGTLRHRWEVPFGLEGQEFQMQLQTLGLAQVVLHKASLRGWVTRVDKPSAAGDG